MARGQAGPLDQRRADAAPNGELGQRHEAVRHCDHPEVAGREQPRKDRQDGQGRRAL